MSSIVPSNPLLTASQVAEILQVTNTTIHNWAKKGHLPKPLMINGRRRWRRTDIIVWLALTEER